MIIKKVSIFLLFIITTSKAAKLDILTKEKQRSFSIFSVVQFPNNECTTTSDKTIKGVCMSSSDCSSNGGTVDGNCASGFGVCCSHRTSTCGSTITNNVTYFQNPGYPSSYSSTGGGIVSCAFNIKSNQGICQIRLDFTSTVLTGPIGAAGGNAAGSCSLDTVTFTSPTGKPIPSFCGTLDGQHMYIETGGLSATTTVTYNIDFTDLSTSRKFSVKASQIACTSLFKPAADCMQYFTGDVGTFSSFNFLGGLLTQNQNYAICIRKNKGFCSLAFSQSTLDSATPSFFIASGPAISDITSMNRQCSAGYVYIAGAGAAVSQSDLLGSADQFCGAYLNPLNSMSTIGVVRAANPSFIVQTYVSRMGLFGSIGFSIDYTQLPC